MVKKTINGVSYDIQRSTRSGKKLMATYTNPQTGNKNTVHYGSTGYQHYKDRTGLLPKSQEHGDPERRKRYIDRHKKNEDWSKPSAGLLAKATLW